MGATPVHVSGGGLAAHYVIERELGRGGMATVDLARDLRHDRDVAVKVMHPAFAALRDAPEVLALGVEGTARVQLPPPTGSGGLAR